MNVRLPPLHTLRAFEAAARSLSFTLAAQELSITQSAVSQQIRGLEAFLGLQLFHRHVRGLSLTDEGHLLADAAKSAIDTISKAALQLQEPSLAGVLTISCVPGFSTQWLIPRLGRFRRQYAMLQTKVLSSWSIVDFRHEDIDVAIRWGKGQWDGLEATRIMPESFVAVCAPKAFVDYQLDDSLNIATAPLVADSDPDLDAWADWFLAANIPEMSPKPWLLLESSVDLIMAAKSGEGVALVPRALVENDLRAGHLLQLSDITVPCPYSYHIVTDPKRAALKKVQAFTRWILEECQ